MKPEFIDWHGGPQPVGDYVIVEAVGHSGHVYKCEAYALEWTYTDGDDHIVKYRVIEDAP